MKVVVLSGGVGGARFLRGVVSVVDPRDVTVIGNVGDDVEVLGLHVSPDLDSVLYGLGGVADEERGWGRADETWNALESAAVLGGEAWFRLGDRDIGLHLVRTQALRAGAPLSQVTAELARALGLRCAVLPATDEPLRTFLETPAGTFPFQTWFVERGHRDEVHAVHYAGAPGAAAAPGVLEALDAADVIAIAPSNPYVSIGPILAVEPIRAALERRSVPCVAVSPLIGGRAVKGPADRMLERLAGGTTPAHVAGCYEGLIDALVLDEADAPAELPDGVRAVVTRTLMSDAGARARLARDVLDAAGLPRVRIAIVGGTGPFGRALAARLVAVGEDELVIGSRDEARARATAEELGGGGGATNEDAVRGADLAVLAVDAKAALDTARALATPLGETPLLSVASVLAFSKDGVRPDPEPRSLAERIQELVAAPVAAGLHSIAASNLAGEPPDEDCFVCGDDPRAKELSLELAADFVAGRALDAGPLAGARTLEGMTAVIVNLNRRYKAHAGIRITGVA